MTTNNTYHWKNLDLNKNYILLEVQNTIKFEIKDLKFNFINSHFKKNAFFIESFTNQYNEILIGIKQVKLINTLLKKYDLTEFKNEFYTISAVMQNEYLKYYSDPADFSVPLLSDFQNESNDLEILFDVLKLNLDEENKSMNSIRFDIGKGHKIENFFVIKNILKRLTKSYGLTLENFEKIKKEELEKTNQHKLESLDEFTKWKICYGLFSFICSHKNKLRIKSDNLRFVGYMLAISQIPINKTLFEISDSRNLEDLVDTDSIKYLNIFIHRPKKFFIK